MKRLLVVLLLLGLVSCAQPHEFAGAVLSDPHPVPSFTLESAAGPVSIDDFDGQYVYLYFGYTFCPDVCPLTLLNLKDVRDAIGPAGEDVQVIMVTVDPERDSAETLAEYTAFFDDSFLGLTGDFAAIDAAGEPFGIYYQKQEGTAESGYLVDHTSRFYLIDPAGNARVAYPHDASVEAITADLEYLLENES